MDKEEINLFWLNCLLIKEGVRPGYILEFEPGNLIKVDYFKDMATDFFKLNTFLFGSLNLLITKEELSEGDKQILSNPTNSGYHTLIGTILGYDCVDTFNLKMISEPRISFAYKINFINSDSRKHLLFTYICPGINIDGKVTVSQENLERAVTYLNSIRNVFRENRYSNLIVLKITLETSYVFPFPRTINRGQLMANGLPMPPSASPIQEGGTRTRTRTRTRRRYIKNKKTIKRKKILKGK